MTNPIQYYNQQIVFHQVLLLKAKQKYSMFSWLRLSIFAFSLILTWLLWPSLISVIPILAGLTGFLLLVSKSEDAKNDVKKQELLIEAYQNELLILEGNWEVNPSGEEFADPLHPFSNDLDLFGWESVYQLLARSYSKKGQKKLASSLSEGIDNPHNMNELILDLKDQIDLCQEFIAEAKLRDEDAQISLDQIGLVKAQKKFSVSLLRWMIPLSFWISSILYFLSFITVLQYSMILVLLLAIIGSQAKIINALFSKMIGFSNSAQRTYYQLIKYNEFDFKNEFWKKEKAAFFDQKSGSLKSLKNLLLLQKQMEYHKNLLVGTILNLTIGWDFNVYLKTLNWIDNNSSEYGKWEAKISEIEVGISGALFYFNNSSALCFATFNMNENFLFENLSHPFIPSDRMVLNDCQLKDEEQFQIITGPNMAGKSTYLRSVGLAIIFANAGFPIKAKSCSLPKINLYTSMRTVDDLNSESSYFFAELNRLKFIVNAVESGEKVFIILDEILKGTNSKDKAEGSFKFMQKLKRMNVKGLIATHDLSLCELSKNKAFTNFFFDSKVVENELVFDYKIRPGICENMNASFLLSHMGLID